MNKNDQNEIRESAKALELAETLLHPHNANLARDIRTLEIELLRALADAKFPFDEGWKE